MAEFDALETKEISAIARSQAGAARGERRGDAGSSIANKARARAADVGATDITGRGVSGLLKQRARTAAAGALGFAVSAVVPGEIQGIAAAGVGGAAVAGAPGAAAAIAIAAAKATVERILREREAREEALRRARGPESIEREFERAGLIRKVGIGFRIAGGLRAGLGRAFEIDPVRTTASILKRMNELAVMPVTLSEKFVNLMAEKLGLPPVPDPIGALNDKIVNFISRSDETRLTRESDIGLWSKQPENAHPAALNAIGTMRNRFLTTATSGAVSLGWKIDAGGEG